jgi:hypothetical protein
LKLPIIGILSGVALATLGISSAAQAAILLPSLTPGSQYRLVFVTSGTRNATSTNIADYNQFVNNTAQASTNLNTALTTAGLTPSAINWTAIGSTASVNARVNTATRPLPTDPSVPIYRVDGFAVASGVNVNADLWDGALTFPINVDEGGNQISNGNSVWTGTDDQGLTSNPLGSSTYVRVGDAFVSNSNWVSWGVGGPSGCAFCIVTPGPSGERRLYGISSIVTVPTATTATPEPSSLLSFITLGGLILGGAVRGVRK